MVFQGKRVECMSIQTHMLGEEIKINSNIWDIINSTGVLTSVIESNLMEENNELICDKEPKGAIQEESYESNFEGEKSYYPMQYDDSPRRWSMT